MQDIKETLSLILLASFRTECFFVVSNDSKRESCITRGLNIVIAKSNRVGFTFSSLTVPKNGFNDSLGTTFVQIEVLFILPV